MKKFKLFSLFFLLTAIRLFSQVPFPFKPLQTKDYYEAFCFLKNNKDKYVGHKFENQFWQAYGTLSAFLGQYKKADRCYYLRDSIFNNLGDSIDHLNISKYAISQLDLNKLYQTNSVILLNEAHYKSEDRAFLYNQLPFLKEKGYKYLAIEALNNGKWLDTDLEKRGYPIYNKTGVYINDPIFAHVIRKALKLGYQLIPYESYSQKREEEQAENIVKVYNPAEGKLVVFAGYAHICEDCNKKLMGSFLKEKLGQDVLSISQDIPNKLRFSMHDSVQFYLANSENECYDYYLTSPRKIDNLNIPGWYELMDFQLQPLHDYYTKTIEIPSLVQVYYPNEQNGIPVFQYLIESENDKNMLLAFPSEGEYNLVVTNSNNIDSLKINTTVRLKFRRR
ncbi:hypothetical protein [Ancylomarina longa]|uniref:Haem-binding uptake Tiki superfamily ChaN domain-containing protein n=1 Tax=Ancylomarina longa TaxID=2487017 RepID=A0A434AUY7_9BACT|nr:hypothetical protein [Ancylomarina longa]RUT78161.1 hypothetical protein DLK05_09965 [Ancylomarina longa]